MKKLIPLLLLLSACSLSYAESMKFITVLSSPVGTFNKLEAVDPAQPAKGNTVNFCTNIGTQGVVELKGTKPAALTTVSLARNTTLGKTDEGKFSLNNITLKQGGSIRGGRLFANTVTVNNAASGKANNVYGNQLTVAGAKTKTLDIGSGKSKINGPGDSTGKEEMVWSNEYQSDTACGNTAACAKQYLLKTQGASFPQQKISCHETALAACGSTGEGYNFWKNLSSCDSVNGWADSYIGSCGYEKACSKDGGALDITPLDSSQCNHPNHALSDADWAIFINPSRATESCSRWGQHGGSVSYIGWAPSGCNRYTLTCGKTVSAIQVYSHTCKLE